jgi:hypothetical protein
MLGNYRVAAQLVGSRVVLSSTELVLVMMLLVVADTFAPVRFEVFTAVTMKNAIFWNVTPCGSYKNRRFGRT